eukprot:3739288-Lingulodinium_polyedra.AAC.1
MGIHRCGLLTNCEPYGRGAPRAICARDATTTARDILPYVRPSTSRDARAPTPAPGTSIVC